MAIGGAIKGYNSFASPHTRLQGTWQQLLDIKTYLEVITPERREKIEAAAKNKRCRSLANLEDQFHDLWETHCDLMKQYDESSGIECHVSLQFRGSVSNLESEVKALLADTRATTRAHTLINLPPPPRKDQSSNSTTNTAPPGPCPRCSAEADRVALEMTAV